MKFEDLLIEHIGQSIDRQLALADLLAGAEGWQIDAEAGTITFGAEYTYPFQILGVESHVSNTWLWAWANDTMLEAYDDVAFDSVNKLKQYGEMYKVSDLSTPQFALDNINGNMLAMVGRGVVEADCFYRAPINDGQGVAFYLLTDTPLHAHVSDVRRINNVIQQMLDITLELSHRRMIRAYLRQQGFDVTRTDEGEGPLDARRGERERITIGFDEEDRVERIDNIV